jgi:hypothetical protein
MRLWCHRPCPLRPDAGLVELTVTIMDSISPSIRRLARQLLATEARAPRALEGQHEAVRACEKMRFSLTKFAGVDGFEALLRRSLALARAEVPALSRITLKADGSMDGFARLAAEEADGGAKAANALISHLLNLLVTFIGKPFTLRLVREAWPGISLAE